MQEKRRISFLGLFIVLSATLCVGVGVMGLLTRDDRMVISVPVVARIPATSGGNMAAREAATAAVVPAAPQEISSPATVTVQSAVARGGSHSKPAVVSQTAPGEVIARAGDLVNGSGTSAFRVEVLSALYDVSGKPTQGCAAFDNNVPVRRLTLQLVVVNDSGVSFRPGEWGAMAFFGNARAILCFSGVGGLPAFANGTRQAITFVAFTNPDQAVTSVTINTLNGLSARACFEEEHVVACPAT